MGTKIDESIGTIVHPANAEDWASSDDRVPVFAVSTEDADGGEANVVTYTMPRKPNPGLALRYLRMVREQGDVASSWLIEAAVGREGAIALEDELVHYDGDVIAFLRGIAEKIQRIVMGGLDAGPKA